MLISAIPSLVFATFLIAVIPNLSFAKATRKNRASYEIMISEEFYFQDTGKVAGKPQQQKPDKKKTGGKKPGIKEIPKSRPKPKPKVVDGIKKPVKIVKPKVIKKLSTF